MVREALVEADIEGGARLLEGLDEAGYPVAAAFWLYDSRPEEWRLYVASSVVAKEGPRKAYERIQSVMGKVSDVGFRLDNIAAVATNDSFVKLLQQAIHTGPGISGIRFTGNVINGTLIEDAYIYRL